MNVGFVGFGNMARALAEGFVRTGALQPDRIGACARDYVKLKTYAESCGFRAFSDAVTLADWADLVVVAVKPHQAEAVLVPLTGILRHKVVISVVAGYDFERYEHILEQGTHHLSTIPNTPVAVGTGIIVCEKTHSLTPDEYALTESLFTNVGLVLAVDTPLLGIAGTVCGCGPAFVCMFSEALSDAAVKHGIPRADAYRMAAQMIAGTGRLLAQTGQHPAVLKDAVCSPAGTTIVGVAELERKGFRGAVIDAIDAIQTK